MVGILLLWARRTHRQQPILRRGQGRAVQVFAFPRQRLAYGERGDKLAEFFSSRPGFYIVSGATVLRGVYRTCDHTAFGSS